ncbi:MAG: PLP-dependent aminotransferase family protein [Lachnospiraceae bacterium]|nr:PLP-dependent aminotransferase family protein [Lachnospiraceae bacterium]MDE7273126.1 PLP-dependent aminotransferase family protein [Lachnospiraceae bacterium]
MESLLSEGIKATPPSFVRGILKAASDPDVISFAGGLPNPISFPQEELLESMERIVKTYGSKVFQYSITAGLPELRQYIADRYNRIFGLNLTIDNILITTGSQQALDLIGKVLLDQGDGVIVEKPTYLAAIQAFSMHRPIFYPVELTEEGMNPEQLANALQNPVKFVYAIPDFQNPTGLTYSAENRRHIYEILKDRNVVLIEDDPYGELRFDGERLPYIGAGKLPNSILLGTFSKTVTPGMRTGFIISENKELLKYISIAKEAGDLHTNIFSQYLIWDYLANNDLEVHIAKIKALYQKQAQAMMDAMDKYFPSTVKYTKPHGGMFLWVTLPEGVSAMSLFPKALERKVAFVPGDPFYTGTEKANTMRLNYTNADCETIEEGIHRLGDLLSTLQLFL